MCPKPKIPKPSEKKEPKPEWLRNPYLDAAVGQSSAVDQLRQGRSSLRIDLGSAQQTAPVSPASPVVTPPPQFHYSPLAIRKGVGSSSRSGRPLQLY